MYADLRLRLILGAVEFVFSGSFVDGLNSVNFPVRLVMRRLDVSIGPFTVLFANFQEMEASLLTLIDCHCCIVVDHVRLMRK